MANARHISRLVSMVLPVLLVGGSIGVTAQGDEIAGIWQSIGYAPDLETALNILTAQYAEV